MFARSEAADKPVVIKAPGGGQCTVLLVSASPDGEVRLRVDKEFREMIVRMRGSKYRDLFNFVQVPAARYQDLSTALQAHQPQVLHISAHAEADGSLLLEGNDDSAKLVSKKRFLALLSAVGGLRLVVLNGCYSDAVASELPAVSELAIGMSDAIADQTAIDFSVAFYESLGFGKSVETAFKVAVASLEDMDDNVPRLFPSIEEDVGKRRKRPLVVV